MWYPSAGKSCKKPLLAGNWLMDGCLILQWRVRAGKPWTCHPCHVNTSPVANKDLAIQENARLVRQWRMPLVRRARTSAEVSARRQKEFGPGRPTRSGKSSVRNRIPNFQGVLAAAHLPYLAPGQHGVVAKRASIEGVC